MAGLKGGAPWLDHEGPVIFLRLPEILRRFAIGRTARYEAMRTGKATRPVKLGGITMCMWPEHEIDALVDRLMAARRPGPPAEPASRPKPADRRQ